MSILLPCLIFFLLFLVWERVTLDRSLLRIPLRIAVTGTRGKSTVVRLLTSIFRENGQTALAKTTGSQAMILLPDGGQIELDRGVRPSIIEQKQLIRKAAQLRVDCLVAEIMSLRPENHYVESRHMLKPNIVVVTNVRRDHTEVMGQTEEQIASVLSLVINTKSEVFLPEKEDTPSFRAEAERCEAVLTRVKTGVSAALLQRAPDLGRTEFCGNLDLVYAVAIHLGIEEEKIIAGMRKAQHDIGRLRVWRYRPIDSEPPRYLVNAFAANDPESTFQVLSKVTDMIPEASANLIGILNLRPDRVPRTAQWISVLKEGAQRRFQQLFVTGDHSGLVRRRVPGVRVLKGSTPQEMMRIVCAETAAPSLIFGFGNIKGAGRLLAEHWNRIGEPYGI